MKNKFLYNVKQAGLLASPFEIGVNSGYDDAFLSNPHLGGFVKADDLSLTKSELYEKYKNKYPCEKFIEYLFDSLSNHSIFEDGLSDGVVYEPFKARAYDVCYISAPPPFTRPTFASKYKDWDGGGSQFAKENKPKNLDYTWSINRDDRHVITFLNNNGLELINSNNFKTSYTYSVPQYFIYLYLILGDIEYKDGKINGVDKLEYLRGLNITSNERFLNTLALNISEGNIILENGFISPKSYLKCNKDLPSDIRLSNLIHTIGYNKVEIDDEKFITYWNDSLHYIPDLDLYKKPNCTLKERFKILKRFNMSNIKDSLCLEMKLFNSIENEFYHFDNIPLLSTNRFAYNNWHIIKDGFIKILDSKLDGCTIVRETKSIHKSNGETLSFKEFVNRIGVTYGVNKMDRFSEFAYPFIESYDNYEVEFEILSGEDIRKGFDPIYHLQRYRRKSNLDNSCMNKGKSRHESGILYYINNPDSRLLTLKVDGLIAGRAVLWKIGDNEYLDKIYTNNPKFDEQMREYCKKNNIECLRDEDNSLRAFSQKLHIKPVENGQNVFLDSFSLFGDYNKN